MTGLLVFLFSWFLGLKLPVFLTHSAQLCSVAAQSVSLPCVSPGFASMLRPPCSLGSSRAALCFPEAQGSMTSLSYSEKGVQVLPQQILGFGALSPRAGLTECPKVHPVPVPGCASCLLCLGVPRALFSSLMGLCLVQGVGSALRQVSLVWGNLCRGAEPHTTACVSLAGDLGPSCAPGARG